MKGLVHLDLQANEMSDLGIAAVAESLKQLNQIKELNLSRNSIGKTPFAPECIENLSQFL
jgi:Leucine-rich repeat (LRR) protein